MFLCWTLLDILTNSSHPSYQGENAVNIFSVNESCFHRPGQVLWFQQLNSYCFCGWRWPFPMPADLHCCLSLPGPFAPCPRLPGSTFSNSSLVISGAHTSQDYGLYSRAGPGPLDTNSRTHRREGERLQEGVKREDWGRHLQYFKFILNLSSTFQGCCPWGVFFVLLKEDTALPCARSQHIPASASRAVSFRRLLLLQGAFFCLFSLFRSCRLDPHAVQNPDAITWAIFQPPTPTRGPGWGEERGEGRGGGSSRPAQRPQRR